MAFSARGYERSRPESSGLILSPLLNLAPISQKGATLRHRRPIVALGSTAPSGSALLCLGPDRRTIQIHLQLDFVIPVEVNLRRLDSSLLDQGPDFEDLLVLEIVHSSSWRMLPPTPICFSLEDRRGCQTLAATTQLLETGFCPSEIRAEAIAGMSLKAPRRQPPPHLRESLFREIAAAECSITAAAATRHVELATLYARQLGSPASVAR